MPIISENFPYRFYFFSNESPRLPRIGIERNHYSARFFLNPVKLDKNYGFELSEVQELEAMVSKHKDSFLQKWNSYLAQARDMRVADVQITDETLCFHLKDGRTISTPLRLYPKLLHANEKQRSHWIACEGGYGIHWPYLDEHVSSEGLLYGEFSR